MVATLVSRLTIMSHVLNMNSENLIAISMQLLSTMKERRLEEMPNYNLLDVEFSITREELINKYNQLI